MRVVWVRLAASITFAFLLVVAAAAADDLSGPVSFVPWKVLLPGDAPGAAPLTLFWVPASADDFKHSDMLFSRPLTAYASQCVAMSVIRADDQSMIAQLGVAGALPVAVLIDGNGKRLGKVDNERGALHLSAVERLVREQLRAREADLDVRLDDARRKAEAGDRAAAVMTYKSIWGLRCLAPRKARTAQRELKKLGVEVAEAQ
jgi:hypothetical protein